MAHGTSLMIIIFLICLNLPRTTCRSRSWSRGIYVIQNSGGITVDHPKRTTTTEIQTTTFPTTVNETESRNATKMIENVLNSVVQTSMNDMLLKLTDSLNDLFSVFTAASRHHRKQMKNEIEARFSSSGNEFVTGFQSSATTMDSDRFTSPENNNDENVVKDNDDTTEEVGRTSQDEKWWRNIFQKILAEKKSDLVRPTTTTTAFPTTKYSSKRDSTDTLSFYQNSETEFENDKMNFTEEFQVTSIPLDFENESTSIISTPLITTTVDVPTSTAGDKGSVAPVWELLIRLDNRLDGVLKNQSSVTGKASAEDQLQSSTSSISMFQIIPDSSKSVLITGDPDLEDFSTKKIVTPLPNRPMAKTNNLFLQTLLVSCAAVFAIFVFSCFGVAFVCYGKRRKHRRIRTAPLSHPFDPITGVGRFPRPVFKTTSSTIPYYYDSARIRNDWSLKSCDRDRQVDTYFASASILDTSCDSSPSTSTHPISIPSATAIMH